jgi:pyruvate formate lyase activating enzyme
MSTSVPGSHEAEFYTKEGGKVKCGLCPHECLIAEGKRGLCGVRENRKGTLYALTYGLASSIHPDPIEKKPFFHFLPGSTAISFSSVGCNLFCRHCQNYSISRAPADDFGLTRITPEDVVRYAGETKSRSVSWTYNEPTIWHEFTTVASKAAHAAGFKTNYVTNGYINEGPLRSLKGLIDAMNIDVKGFTEPFYKEICGGRLSPVLRTCELAVELGIHVELTYLVIPGRNDSDADLSAFSRWVVDRVGKEVPVHFSAFHPDYKMTDIPSTPMSTMENAYRTGKRLGLEFVYVGNVRAGEMDDTFCPKCGSLAIEREGFWVGSTALKGDKCANCGASLNLVI